MRIRSLVQVLLGMLGFVLGIEFITALGNGVVHIGGAVVGAPVIFLALLLDGAALVVVSASRRGQ